MCNFFQNIIFWRSNYRDRYCISGVAIENLTITPNFWIAEQNVLQEFDISWDRGSDVVLTVQYGDGLSYTWAWDEQNHTVSYRRKVVTVTHNYTTLANVTLIAITSNQVGTSETTADVVIQPNLGYYLGMTLVYVPGPTPLDVVFSFDILPSVSSPIPILFWCNISYDDPQSANPSVLVYGMIDDSPFTTGHTFKTDRPQSNPTALCFNHISSTTLLDVVVLREAITFLEINAEKLAWETDEMVALNVTMKTGSHAKFTIVYGDGSEENRTHPNRISNSEPMSFQHVYTSPNNYTVFVKAYNEFFQDTANISLILQNRVQGITLDSSSNVAYPPGTFTVVLEPSSVLPIPTDVWISAVLLNSVVISNVYSEALSTGQVYHETVTVSRDYCGENHNLSILCYNLASQQTIQTQISVYEVITGLQITPIPRTTLPNETWALEIIISTGSSVSYFIDFDDGDTQAVIHQSLFASDHKVTLYKNYTYVDNFTVTVTASNPVSSESGTFLYLWSCYPPNITIPDELLNQEEPKEVYKSRLFQFEPELYIVCIDTQVVVYHWTVLDYYSHSVLPFESRQENFTLPERRLAYGRYIVRLNASMYQKENTTSVADFFIEIIPTPLEAYIVGGPDSGIVFGRTASIDGWQESLDLDEDPGNQRNGLIYRYISNCSFTLAVPINNECV